MKSIKATLLLLALCTSANLFPSALDAAPTPVKRNQAASQYLELLENFAGWAETHWNEKTQSYDAKGAGVTWSRGNGDVCLVYATLLTEFPDRKTFSPRKIPRAVMLDHVQRSIRTLCLQNKNCTDPQAIKPATWGGPDWQAALETEHWVFAAHLLGDQLDASTRALVRQVASAEADAAVKKIPSGKKGNTAADDCSWNAAFLGLVAAIYADDPRAAKWDEWAKRWALNIEARATDRESKRMVDGKPLGEWLVSENAHPDLTVENHGFWNLPYQVSFSELLIPILAHHMTGKKIPEAYTLNALEEGDHILKWVTLPDGDLLCPQGVDWAERDVQHSWAFTLIGTVLDQAWARAAEQRCLDLVTHRQKNFGDGALHANDFGYETDLARVWTYSFLTHKYFGRRHSGTEFAEPQGAKTFPHVDVAMYRTPDMVSSVTWYGSRQAVMIVPNNAKALGEFPSLTSYRWDASAYQISGLGHLRLEGEKKPAAFRVEGEPRIDQAHGALAVSFTHTIPGVARQKVGYAALPTGAVVVFSHWVALKDINVAEVADHPFYWLEIPGFLPERTATKDKNGVWSVDGKLQMQIFGGNPGKLVKSGLLGAVRTGPWLAKAGEVLQQSACVYQAQGRGLKPIAASGGENRIVIGKWTVERGPDGRVSVKN